MDKIRSLWKIPWVPLVTAFVVGLLIGLPILGWWIWPVQWVDAEPRDLRADLKSDFLCLIVDSYAVNGDLPLALQRLEVAGLTGDAAADALRALKPEQCRRENAEKIMSLVGAVQATDSGTVTKPTSIIPSEVTPPSPTSAAPTTNKNSNAFSYLLLAGLCVVLLAIAGAIVYFLFLRNRKPMDSRAEVAGKQGRSVTPPSVRAEVTPVEDDQPVAQFVTTYNLGDDFYDDSFGIDSPAGQFMGECGVGISDIIGVGEPKKVTAFEVWLFDKNDIQTITKVLMSPHAYDDPSIRQKLSKKGEPVVIEPGLSILVETATLQLEARVLDLEFGDGPLPPQSYIERLTLEITVWPKLEA
jgi:hypothetical protein